ncbi:capsular exopolysaccharide family [Hathewaya proteolytica DSM 3090]|uniref:non-specific protein-tyrosine kinase n=1 Tax=Hathewaya proteolytica DSM 3090 TaxID=1121331 RepID=A0A1M6Q376_9CLOT|nr:CpsD/CapB family tyrosine-protein kinase [Hathewaya proteolytica]SHK14608.1 capsular exopolysaccharide family [Hathewaya proteolytica DSM 3090]
MFVVDNEPKSIAAENFRTLRTNIQYSSIDDKYKVIAVTSSEPGEGKSTISGNLAIALSQNDNKVVLLDCDLRKPSLHKKFRISNSEGVSELILGKDNLTAVGYKYNDNLVVITSGKIPPNPSEMLGSKSMNSLIEMLKKAFDYVILDTPPLQAVTDAQILSARADGVIIVVEAGKTKKNLVQNSVNLLKKVNANIIGIVLNKLDNANEKYYKYYGKTEKK